MAKGRTLWEALMAHVRGPLELRYYNPLQAKMGASLTIDELDLREMAFTVREIREWRRDIGGQTFRFTDYQLRGFDGNEEMAARLRLNPLDSIGSTEKLEHSALVLRLDDEFAHDEDFVQMLGDPEGVFRIERDGEIEAEFHRLHGLIDPYRASVTLLRDENDDQRVDADETRTFAVDYWDFARSTRDEAGQETMEFLFVEMDANTGWIQLWRGSEIDPHRVLVL